MYRNNHDTTTSNPLAWTQSQSANMPSVGDEDAGAEADEPPDLVAPLPCAFQRTSIKKPAEKSSLLTKAIKADNEDEEEDDDHHHDAPVLSAYGRRRSMASNGSLASTADLTSDTGLTSPSRTNTPSPPIPETSILRISAEHFHKKLQVRPPTSNAQVQKPEIIAPAADAPPKKRCISFACTTASTYKPPVTPLLAPPVRPTPVAKTNSALEAPRRPCIKFACPARPASTQNTPPLSRTSTVDSVPVLPSVKINAPSSPRKSGLSNSLRATPSPRSSPRKNQRFTIPAPASARPKFLRANSNELVRDSSQFHEFASNENREDDWIRQDKKAAKCKLTIDDVMVKENNIRRLAKEAEEEAELEDEEAEAEIDQDDDDAEEADDDDADEDDADDDDDDDDEEEEEDDVDTFEEAVEEAEDDDECGGSDGYRSDEETGFAESDEEEDEVHDLWSASDADPYSIVNASVRRASEGQDHFSDCSTAGNSIRSTRRIKQKRVKAIPAPELPDSTDFVCGTFDEDRPLEAAYMSCIEARKREKLHIIPQDIDPSFPADPLEEEDEDDYEKPDESDEHVWLHGEMEDLHHEQETRSRRKTKGHVSPRRYHSPPPAKGNKGRVSPTLRPVRARSPGRLLGGRTPPSRTRSPPSQVVSPAMSPGHQHRTAGVAFDMTQTKSLPKPPGMFHQLRHGRRGSRMPVSTPMPMLSADIHVRCAIDIVKGLEQKRKRRREKFFHKYCDRARKGQIPERKPIPGIGAEKMKEVGLLMAGKKDQGNFVMSV